MSDSDDDLLQNNVFTYNNENTTISASGPIVNNINISGLNLHNNVLTSNQRYVGSNIYQRSMRYGREMSPMSLRSARDYGPCNFNRASFRRGMGFQRSLYCARSGSPGTVHSINSNECSSPSGNIYHTPKRAKSSKVHLLRKLGDHILKVTGIKANPTDRNSTASLRAADIIFAFKNERFDKHDLKAIKEAFNKLMKTSQRKRVEKRRNHRLLMIRNHQHSGEDSGEQGGNSSISSDDCRSIKTTTCHENRRDLARFSRNIKENEVFRDCSESIKQTSMKNWCPTVSNYDTRERIQNITTIDQSQSPVKVQSTSIITHKERFKKGFLLPSQRFNKTIGRIQVSGKNKIITNGNMNKVCGATEMVGSETDSDSEEIFRGFSKNPQQELKQKKRALENDGVLYSRNKRSKLDSPRRLQNTEFVDSTLKTGTNNTLDDFIFTKPKLPIKKVQSKIDLGPEKLLARSKVPVITEQDDFDISKINSNDEANSELTINAKQPDTLQSTTSDVSMRPSFIKRKLFTQKLDVAEKKNLSCDSTPANSPQNIYSASMREKNKARKLVASQSCLSREVPTEDSNILDLIHKIVPANQINVTNVTNKTELCSKSNNVDNSEKWDVTTAISKCNNQDLSDTYTDEEIFGVTYDKNVANTKAKSEKATKNAKEDANCKVVVKKLNSKVLDKVLKDNNNYKLPQLKSTCEETNKKSVIDCVKLFWDTDFESDVELNKVTHSWKKNAQKYQEPVHSGQKEQNNSDDKPKSSDKVAPISKGAILTVRNCHREPKLNLSVKSKKNHVVDDKSVTEYIQPNSMVQDKLDNSKLGTPVSKVSNKKSCTDKKNIGKENVSVTKEQRSGRKSKAKRGGNNGLVVNKNIDTSTRPNSSVRLRDKDSKETPKTSNNKQQHSVSSKQAPKQTKGNNTNKTVKSIENNDVKIQKQITNVRIQPKRKSKEHTSYTLSPQPSVRSNNTKASDTRIKTTTQLASKNTSLNSINTRSSCSSRQKVSFNCSACDNSSINISNISSRSLRFCQRNRNELYKSRL